MLLRTYLSDFVFFSHFLSFRPLRALIFGRSGRSFFFLVLTVVKKCYRLISRNNLPTTAIHNRRPTTHDLQPTTDSHPSKPLCQRLLPLVTTSQPPHHPPKHKIQGNICKLIEKALSLLEKRKHGQTIILPRLYSISASHRA